MRSQFNCHHCIHLPASRAALDYPKHALLLWICVGLSDALPNSSLPRIISDRKALYSLSIQLHYNSTIPVPLTFPFLPAPAWGRSSRVETSARTAVQRATGGCFFESKGGCSFKSGRGCSFKSGRGCSLESGRGCSLESRLPLAALCFNSMVS